MEKYNNKENNNSLLKGDIESNSTENNTVVISPFIDDFSSSSSERVWTTPDGLECKISPINEESSVEENKKEEEYLNKIKEEIELLKTDDAFYDDFTPDLNDDKELHQECYTEGSDFFKLCNCFGKFGKIGTRTIGYTEKYDVDVIISKLKDAYPGLTTNKELYDAIMLIDLNDNRGINVMIKEVLEKLQCK